MSLMDTESWLRLLFFNCLKGSKSLAGSDLTTNSGLDFILSSRN